MHRVDDQLRLLERAARPGPGHGHRLDHGVDRPHHPGGVNHQKLSGGRQRRGAAGGTQQGLNLGQHLRQIAASQREEHAHQFELAVLVELVQRDPRNEPLGNAFRQIDHHQQPLMPQQGVALGQQHAIKQIQGLGGRILLGVGVVEGARRRRVEHQRQVGLSGKPFQHVDPALKTEVEAQTRLAGPSVQQGPLFFRKHGRQFLVVFPHHRRPLWARRLGDRLGPLRKDLRHLFALRVRKTRAIGHHRMRQLDVIKFRILAALRLCVGRTNRVGRRGGGRFSGGWAGRCCRRRSSGGRRRALRKGRAAAKRCRRAGNQGRRAGNGCRRAGNGRRCTRNGRRCAGCRCHRAGRAGGGALRRAPNADARLHERRIQAGRCSANGGRRRKPGSCRRALRRGKRRRLVNASRRKGSLGERARARLVCRVSWRRAVHRPGSGA